MKWCDGRGKPHVELSALLMFCNLCLHHCPLILFPHPNPLPSSQFSFFSYCALFLPNYLVHQHSLYELLYWFYISTVACWPNLVSSKLISIFCYSNLLGPLCSKYQKRMEAYCSEESPSNLLICHLSFPFFGIWYMRRRFSSSQQITPSLVYCLLGFH